MREAESMAAVQCGSQQPEARVSYSATATGTHVRTLLARQLKRSGLDEYP
jgi:hypothetical protein